MTLHSILMSISLSLALYSLLLHRFIKVGSFGAYGGLDTEKGNRMLAWAIFFAVLAR